MRRVRDPYTPQSINVALTGYLYVRLAVPHAGHARAAPVGPSSSACSRFVLSGSSDAAYASIAAIVALFFKSSKTILSSPGASTVFHTAVQYAGAITPFNGR